MIYVYCFTSIVHAFLHIPNYKCPGEETLRKCLGHHIKGPIYYRKDFAYKGDLLLENNARVVYFPVAFVHPVDVLDVQSAIKCGAKLNFTVIARSGGHSFESYSIGDRDCTIIVDLRYMNKIIINVTTQTAKIETGNTLDTLYRSLNEHVFAFPSGGCSSIGVGGIILGGGHGYIMRKFGMSCDNILDAQIVLANGTIVNYAKKYPDLFWALRGAGNAGYGIVTTLTLKIYPIQKIITSMAFTYDFDQAQLVYSVINKLGNSFHQNFTLMIDHRNNTIFQIRGYYLGSLNEAKPHIQELIKLTKPRNESYVEGEWYNTFLENTTGTRNYYKVKSFYINSPGLSYEGVEYLMKFIKNFKCAFLVETLLIGGGRVNEIGQNETAFVHRSFMYVQTIEAVLDENNYEICLKDLDNFSLVFQNNYTSSESYQNVIDRELDNWQCRYYGDDFGKLVKIKQKYDPNNLFNWNQSIPTNTEISCY
ncbi:46_t:CDS:2 [Cetraspora pellucida]|uniref:46_t:CDS:1 n=1 Tax=Cetraspora pellucida TaxID=1433469 RepID=A0ACA9KKW5_9GLOM|nr:46_t:CDS:2 [Cetraspora pellucida]